MAYIYKGDPGAVIGDGHQGWGFQSWRTWSIVWFSNASQWIGNFLKDPGQTRAYGFLSPANGSTLSSQDEDGVAHDCYLWDDSGYADNSNWTYDVSFPYSTQGQAHFSGSGSNPFESSLAKISWDMRTVVDTSNLDWVTAYVNYNHTCYPSHGIMVNNYLIYQYIPPRNDTTYIFNCLVLQSGKIIGQQQSSTHVPCN